MGLYDINFQNQRNNIGLQQQQLPNYLNNSGYSNNFGNMAPVDYGMGNMVNSGGLDFMGGGQGLQMPNQQNQLMGNMPISGNGLNFGMNVPTAALGLNALNSLTGLYTGLKSLKLAKDQFDFTKNITNTNMGNTTKNYNMNLEDRLRTRDQFNQSDKAKTDYEKYKATTSA